MTAPNTSVTSPANGTTAVHTILTQLLAAGWLVKAWSDGTTLVSDVSLSSNPYGSASSGAGNLGNTSAWFRVQSADASREWLFQRGASETSWTVSRTIGGTPFTGGTPNATTAGTSAAATALFSAASLFSATPGRMFLSADTTAPYRWTAFLITLGGGNVLTWLGDEPLATGSYDSDADPYVWCGYYNGTGLAPGALVPNAGSSAIVYKRFVGAGSKQRASVLPPFHGNLAGNYCAPAQTTSTQGGPTQTSKEVPIRIHVMRGGATSTTTGWIGQTSGLRWSTVGGRANGSTLYDGTNYWCFMAGIWVPWDSSTPSLS